jgi:hypothetical protein
MKMKNRLLCLMLLLSSFGLQAQQASGVGAGAQDPFGLSMIVTAFIVVLCALIVMYVFFRLFTAISISYTARRTAKLKGGFVKGAKKEVVPGEVYAAISMALYDLSNDAHDIENTVLTIVRTRRSYSPWSSKIYGLRQIPNRNRHPH